MADLLVLGCTILDSYKYKRQTNTLLLIKRQSIG